MNRKLTPRLKRKTARAEHSKPVIKQKPMSLVEAVKELTLASNNLNAQVNGLRLAVSKIVKKMDID